MLGNIIYSYNSGVNIVLGSSSVAYRVNVLYINNNNSLANALDIYINSLNVFLAAFIKSS